MFGAPGLEVRHGDQGGKLIALAAEDGKGALAADDVRRDVHLGVVKVRRDAKGAHIALRHAFDPYALPDAALRRVPDAAALRLLLAAGVEALIGVVRHTYDDGKLPFAEGFGDLRVKGQIAADVRDDVDAVHPDVRGLIHGAEVQDHTPAGKALGQRERAAIPEVLSALKRLLHAGERRFRRKGHGDITVECFRDGPVRRDGVFPQAVEAHPAFADELRARVFRQRVRRADRACPFCVHPPTSVKNAVRPIRTGRGSLPCRPAAWPSTCSSRRRPP